MKTERINLTPGYCRDLKSKDKKYFVKDLKLPISISKYIVDKFLSEYENKK